MLLAPSSFARLPVDAAVFWRGHPGIRWDSELRLLNRFQLLERVPMLNMKSFPSKLRHLLMNKNPDPFCFILALTWIAVDIVL